MGARREVLTLQLGHYANFVGSHWWNAQEASFNYAGGESQSQVDCDVLYKEGVTGRGEVTFTPRLLLVDLKGSLGGLSEAGELYERTSGGPIKESQARWDGAVVMCRQQSAPKNPFVRKLEGDNMTCDDEDKDTCHDGREDQPASSSASAPLSDVCLWSDFLIPHLHPRTVMTLRNHHPESSPDIPPFGWFGQGTSIFTENPDLRDDFEDRIRHLVEECDNPDAFHVIVDTSDAFSGMAANAASHLADEYSGQSALFFPVNSKQGPISNTVLCYDAISRRSVLVPLSANKSPHLPSLDLDRPYHTSAVLAAALDTLTLPHRLKQPHLHSDWGSASEMAAIISQSGRKVAALQTWLPAGIKVDGGLDNILSSLEASQERIYTQLLSVRGAETLYSADTKSNPNTRAANPSELCRAHMQRAYPQTTTAVCGLTSDPFRVSVAYPNIFASDVTFDGLIGGEPRQGQVRSVPVMTSVQSSQAVGAELGRLAGVAGKMPAWRNRTLFESGVEPDEYAESIENIRVLSECYQD